MEQTWQIGRLETSWMDPYRSCVCRRHLSSSTTHVRWSVKRRNLNFEMRKSDAKRRKHRTQTRDAQYAKHDRVPYRSVHDRMVTPIQLRPEDRRMRHGRRVSSRRASSPRISSRIFAQKRFRPESDVLLVNGIRASSAAMVPGRRRHERSHLHVRTVGRWKCLVLGQQRHGTA